MFFSEHLFFSFMVAGLGITRQLTGWETVYYYTFHTFRVFKVGRIFD